MKKFLVFLVSCIVAICLGMTFYYFVKDEEVIQIKTSTLYLNAGDSISLEELGFSHTHKKSETKIDFNAGGETVESIIKYDSTLKKYVTTAQGGSTTIIITTNNKKFAKFEINVVVGNGSAEAPFHISTEEELFAIGTSKYDTTPDDDANNALTAHYELMNDITIADEHYAIGYNEDGNCETFEGVFDGNYHTIKDLDIDSKSYGGLFAIIGKNATVQDLYFEDARLVGSYDYVGTLAGVINGYVDRVAIKNSNIQNAKVSTTTFTGGLAGKIVTDNDEINNFGIASTVYRVSIENSSSSSRISGAHYVGGIAGEINCANIEAIKVDSKIKSTATSGGYIGGFAGMLVLNNDFGFVRESYSLSTITLANDTGYKGALFGYINAGDGSSINTDTVLLGLYFNKDNTNLTAYGSTTAMLDLTTVAGKTTSELKTKNTYVYYYNSDSSTITWLNTIWKITEGQYPILKYTTTLPSEVNKGESTTVTPSEPDTDVTTPENPTDEDNTTPTTPDSPIISPDIPSVNTDVISISNAEELAKIGSASNKTYKLTNNIDLNGAVWTPVQLNSSTFTSEYSDNTGVYYVISNFTIRPTTTYCGFFSSIYKSAVSNIVFENVTIEVVSGVDYIGTLAGKVNGGTISNIYVRNLTIKSTLASTTEISNLPQYTGGLVGVITSTSCAITDSEVTGSITGNLLNVGGLVGMTGSNTIISDSKFEGELEARTGAGAIAFQNQGSIRSCSAIATISSYSQKASHAYFGGAVAVNFNTLANTTINLTMSLSNDCLSYIYSVGGVVGYNMDTAVVSECSVIGTGIKINTNNGNIYLGGIVGENKGTVKNSKNLTQLIGNTYALVNAGGIVGNNIGGNIKACLATSDVYGAFVGGIAYRNTEYGVIEECAITTNSAGEKPCIKGKYIAGIIHSALSGEIKNCLAITKTYGVDENSVSASIVIYFPYTSDNYATISFCVVSNEFANNGSKYLETPSDIFSKTRCTGTITNCVIDSTYATDVNEATVDKSFFGLIKHKIASGSSYFKATSTQMTQISSYTDFSISSTVSTTWFYNGKTIPTLSWLIKE